MKKLLHYTLGYIQTTEEFDPDASFVIAGEADKQIAEYQELAKLIVAGKFIHFTDRLAIITLAKKLLEGD